MSLRCILFDLDGTLLPMDQDVFIATYLKHMAAHLLPHGYEPNAFVKSIWSGIAAMVQNNGSCTNEDAFWNTMKGIYAERSHSCKAILEDFYQRQFYLVGKACGFNPLAGPTIKKLKEMGFTLALATNPIFPSIATENRMEWAGLDRNDFALYTTYENSRYCKPNPDYYREVLEKLGAKPEECLMVGNDATEDLAAAQLGIDVYLLTECLINKQQTDIREYPQGDLNTLLQYIQSR
jgi:FMN phosphatase YigB (HAD superfamily)